MSEDKRSRFFVTMKGVSLDEPGEEEIDEGFLNGLGLLIFEDETQLATVVEERVKEVELAYRILNGIVIGENLWIACRIHAPVPSMGVVTVTGEDIEIDDMEQFRRVVSLASNIEVCTKADGTVDIDFTFHGLMRR